MTKVEKIYQRALKGYKKVWRFEDKTIPILNTINNLSLLYADQGKMAETEKIYQRTLKGYEKARGPESISTPSATRTFFTKLRAR